MHFTPETERIAVMLFISTLMHAFLIYAVGFAFPQAKRSWNPPIKIILVQNRSETEPDEADFVAQASREGSGNSKKDIQPKTPTIAPFPDNESRIVVLPPPTPLPAPHQISEVEALTVRRPSSHQVVTNESLVATKEMSDQGEAENEKVMPKIHVDVQPAEMLTILTSLKAEIDDFKEAEAKRPKKSYSHGPGAKGEAFARYEKMLCLKAEQVGTAYYRQEIRKRPFFGKILVQVAINANGTIYSIEFPDSSDQASRGRQRLEDAVRQILHLSAPFGFFPEAMRKKSDIHYITYYWRFERGETINLGSERNRH